MRIIDFDIYRELLKEKSGLVLTPDKSYLLDSRLNPVAKKWGYSSLETMTIALQGVPDIDLVTDITEAMTTNETSFFRNASAFDALRDIVMKHMLGKRGMKRQLRIWCAGASSGQEAYSVAMLLKEMEARVSGWRIDILATDISNDVLAQAREGLYSQFEVQRGLPVRLLMKYFTQAEEKWQIKPEIRKMVRHEYFNLLDPMTAFAKFDIILCRNVLVYFDDETRDNVLQRISGHLEKDGFLLMGARETSAGGGAFAPVQGQPGLFALRDGPHSPKN